MSTARVDPQLPPHFSSTNLPSSPQQPYDSTTSAAASRNAPPAAQLTARPAAMPANGKLMRPKKPPTAPDSSTKVVTGPPPNTKLARRPAVASGNENLPRAAAGAGQVPCDMPSWRRGADVCMEAWSERTREWQAAPVAAGAAGDDC